MMRVNQDSLQSRLRDVEDALGDAGHAALVVYGNGSALGAGSRTHGYLRYLVDWDGHNSPSVLVLAPGRTPRLLTSNIFLSFLGRELMWFEDVRFVKPPNFAVAIAQILDDAGCRDGRVGYVGRDETPVPIWEDLVRALPRVEWIDFTAELDRRRVVKDPLQLSFHRRAAALCDDIFETVAREVRSGKRSYQIQAEMEYTARFAGAEYVLTWLTVQPVADYSRFYKEECMRVPERGDQVLAGIYLIYDGHWGHAIRTGTYGAPSDDQRRVFDIALQMEDAGLDRLRSGGNLYDVNAAFDAVLHRHYPETEAIFRFRAAHALGHSYEDPIASAPFPQPYDDSLRKPEEDAFMEIEPGMLFEFHPNLFVPGVAGAVIGDMIVTTDNAPEIMNQFPRELISW